MLKFLKYSLFLGIVFLPLLAGWMMLADRLGTRTHKAMYNQLNSVRQIWGATWRNRCLRYATNALAPMCQR
jgi:hypothetical protein